MTARSSAIHLTLLGASRAHRSPALRFFAERKARACAIIASRSRPVTVTGPGSRSSVRMVWSAEVSSRAKIWSRKDIQFKKATTTESTQEHRGTPQSQLCYFAYTRFIHLESWRRANGVVYQAVAGLSATRIRAQAVRVTAARRSIIA